MTYFAALLLCLLAYPAVAEDASSAFIPEEQAQPAASAPEKTETPSAASGPAFMGGKDGTIDITADQSLEWNETERVYVARGHAKAKRGDVTIEADLLKAYDRKKPDGSSEVWKMTAEGNVKVTGKAQSATGQTAEYDIDSRKAILKGNNLKFVTATDNVTATDSLEYWEAESRAVAKGNAVANRTEANGEKRSVRADQLAVVFRNNEKGEQTADRMEARGKVHIVTAKNVVFCDEAIYDVTPNMARLTGDVKITSGESQLKGDRVEANFKTGISKIMNNGSGRVHALVTSSQGKDSGKKTGAGK
jgi:lipopolysaccharide export system protein LptA